MDCKEFREALDLFVDGELAAGAAAVANTHAGECGSCRRAYEDLLKLRRSVQKVVREQELPAHLEQVVRGRLSSRRRGLWVAAAVFVATLIGLAAGVGPTARGVAAQAMEFVAFHVDPPRVVELEGKLVCRDCELETLYGTKTMCHLKGHHAALKTRDGKIWNLMEGEHTEALIHDDSLRGRTIRIRGKIYRRAGCIEVESYRVL
jgi:hypothetical protein